LRQVLAALVLGAVFAASVLNQFHFPWWERVVARLDRFVFLPSSAFFAPNPGFAGVHLGLRDRAPARLSGWSEILLPSTTSWRWLWNPARYERKALQDYLSGLTRKCRAGAAGADARAHRRLRRAAWHGVTRSREWRVERPTASSPSFRRSAMAHGVSCGRSSSHANFHMADPELAISIAFRTAAAALATGFLEQLAVYGRAFGASGPFSTTVATALRTSAVRRLVAGNGLLGVLCLGAVAASIGAPVLGRSLCRAASWARSRSLCDRFEVATRERK
jgi:hypothetical protein